MKTIIRSITIVGAVLILSATGVRAQDSSKVYFHVDAGGAYVQDVTIHSGGGSAMATFNPGVRGDLALGYNINDSWAVELESGVIWNSVDRLGGHALSGVSIDLYQVPILANVIYKIPLQNSKWTPYLGAGAGGVFTDLSDNGGGFTKLSGNSENGNDFTFAYQAMAGIKYALSAHAQVDLSYKFFGTLDQSLSLGGGTFRSDALFTHAVLLSFTWTF